MELEINILKNDQSVTHSTFDGSLKRSPKRKKFTETIVAWVPRNNPDKEMNQLAFIPWPDNEGILDRYEELRNTHFFTDGACFPHVRDADYETSKKMCFILAMHIIIRDKLDAEAVHSAFFEHIEEYADGCASDMPSLM